MISLLTWTVLLLLFLAVNAWALARSARAVGSPRGRFGVGLLAVLMIMVINAGFMAVAALHSPKGATLPALAFSLVILVLQIVATFIVLQLSFSLSTIRTLAPMGAQFAVGIVQLGLILGIVRPFISHAFVLPTRSMAPTLNEGDRFFVNKTLQPRRFDLVAYRNTTPNHDIWCKRLIGLPGEELRFENGNVYINDQAVELPPVIAGRCHATVGGSPHKYDDGDTITLGDDELFFLGDNLDQSGDSRAFGPSHESDVLGVVDFIYWPPKHVGILR